MTIRIILPVIPHRSTLLANILVTIFQKSCRTGAGGKILPDAIQTGENPDISGALQVSVTRSNGTYVDGPLLPFFHP